MTHFKREIANFVNVLEPVKSRFVSAEFLANMSEHQLENVEKIEFKPPKIGDDNFGKFELTYRHPQLCEVSR